MTIHEICETARLVPCLYGAAPGEDCTCGPCGVHLARIITARRLDLLTGRDVETAIQASSETPGAILRDTEAAA